MTDVSMKTLPRSREALEFERRLKGQKQRTSLDHSTSLNGVTHITHTGQRLAQILVMSQVS